MSPMSSNGAGLHGCTARIHVWGGSHLLQQVWDLITSHRSPDTLVTAIPLAWSPHTSGTQATLMRATAGRSAAPSSLAHGGTLDSIKTTQKVLTCVAARRQGCTAPASWPVYASMQGLAGTLATCCLMAWCLALH